MLNDRGVATKIRAMIKSSGGVGHENAPDAVAVANGVVRPRYGAS